MKTLRVYGVNYDGRERRVVAAHSMAEAARLCGISYHTFRNYGCETGNVEEIACALQEPRGVWRMVYKGFGKLERLP